MRIFNCRHSLLGNCFICRMMRRELSDLQIFIFVTFFFGAVFSLAGLWK